MNWEPWRVFFGLIPAPTETAADREVAAQITENDPPEPFDDPRPRCVVCRDPFTPSARGPDRCSVCRAVCSYAPA